MNVPEPATAHHPAHRPELDGLRALAVLAVVVFHAYAPVASRLEQTPLQAVGARGVDLFFVLSGFCLSLGYDRGPMLTVGEALSFLRRRFTRIAPPYYVALALFAFLALTPFGIPGTFGHTTAAVQGHELLGDAFFLPTLSPIHDPPMWTLGIEMRWYLLFAPLLLLFARAKIVFAALAVACWWVAHAIGLPDAATLPTFMLGIVAAELSRKPRPFDRLWPLAAIVLTGLALADQLRALSIDHGSPIWAFACFGIVMAVVTNAHLKRLFSFRPFVAIGIASYSIYLMHSPFLNALVWAGWPAWLAGAASIAIGFGFWYAVERPLGSRRARTAIDRAMVGAWRAVSRKPAPARG